MNTLLNLTFCLGLLASMPADDEWPMLARDASRSGATAVELRPPFERKWYRLFPDEGLMSGIQPVVAGGRVHVGTLRGTLYAIDATTGEDVWTFSAGGAILHTAAAGEGKVFFGAADGKVYALDAATGGLAWTVDSGAAVWNSPALCDGLVLIGSRDGRLYAMEAADGTVRWSAETGGPILNSPAVDAERGCVYIGSEDMHVYAFDLRDGSRRWRSDKLPGVSFRGYHPVIAPDGGVMVTTTPAAGGDAFQELLLEMVKEVFGDFASWRHKAEENARLREANFQLMEQPETYPRQLDYFRRRLREDPSWQTFFVLDPQTGRQKFIAPIIYSESMNGPGAPAVVTPDGQVIVKYQALLRSRYQHYSPFLNPGYLDTSTGNITPLMDQTRTYGWYDGQRMVHDEQCQLVVSGRVLINTAQDVVTGLDLDTRIGYGQPFCRNIHEPKPGEALGILLKVLRGETLPPGKEWIVRGTAVYGGGSVIATPISIAGDSFYYVPTHELNAGVAVIAYRMQADGTAAQERPAPVIEPSPEETERIHGLPWEWDTLEAHRMRQVLESLPEPVPGTLRQPLAEDAAGRARRIDPAELDRFIWEARRTEPPTAPAQVRLREALAEQVAETIAQQWQPLQFPAGKHPREAYRLFAEPTHTLEALAGAYPHLNDEQQRDVRQYVAHLRVPGGPLDGPTGRRVFEPQAGENRAAYDLPPLANLSSVDEMVRNDLARLYPLWLWAHVSGDWNRLTDDWSQLRGLVDSAPNPIEQDCHNGRVGGLIAYCRIAHRLGDEAALQRGVERARQALRDRVQYEWTYSRGGLSYRVPTERTIFSRWRHLTPEVGRLCSEYARETQQHLMEVYVDYHRPTWWLAWNVELMWRNENPFVLPTAAADVFAARALVLDEPAEALEAFLDLPWCRADLYYLQKLVLCLEAGVPAEWQDVRVRSAVRTD